MVLSTDAHRLLAVLQQHVGAQAGASVVQLVTELGYAGTKASERRIRSLVEELRSQGHHVCAHPSRGYFIAENPEQMEETLRFLYRRAMCALRQIAAIRRVSTPDLEGQLRIRL